MGRPTGKANTTTDTSAATTSSSTGRINARGLFFFFGRAFPQRGQILAFLGISISQEGQVMTFPFFSFFAFSGFGCFSFAICPHLSSISSANGGPRSQTTQF